MIFIPGNVPSSKNSKVWTGKFFVWSKACNKYVKESKDFWIENKQSFLLEVKGKKKPYKVHFKFIRNSKHRFDYVNPLQTILDLMVKYEWIEDDNADIIMPIFDVYEYNKNNGGVYITLK